MFNKWDENYIYEIVSKNIKQQRIKRGWTQKQLAEKTHYSLQFISNIESKTHQTFSLGTVYKIALTLEIELYLLFIVDDKEKI